MQLAALVLAFAVSAAIHGVFPEELIANFIKTKREECRQLAAIPHPAEFDRYYNL